MTITVSALAGLRAEFPVTGRLIYLDIANKVVPSRRVADAATAFFASAWADGGATAYAPGRVEAVRGRMAQLVGADPGEVAFVKNTSEGLNAALHALGLRANDNVVTTDAEHPNLLLALDRLASRGVEIRPVAAAGDGIATERVVGACDARTRLVAVSHVTWAIGHRVDVPAIAAACRPRGIVVLVDAIQAVGVLDIDVRQLGADILVAGAHKGLLAVNGVGILYCRQALVPHLEPAFAARASMAPASLAAGTPALAHDAHRFEYGNPNYLGIHLLGAAVSVLEEIGVPRIERRVRALTEHLLDALEQHGRRVLTPRPWERRAGIIAVADADPPRTVARLRDQGIVVSARGGAIRVSPHFYNTEDELDTFVSRLHEA